MLPKSNPITISQEELETYLFDYCAELSADASFVSKEHIHNIIATAYMLGYDYCKAEYCLHNQEPPISTTICVDGMLTPLG